MNICFKRGHDLDLKYKFSNCLSFNLYNASPRFLKVSQKYWRRDADLWLTNLSYVNKACAMFAYIGPVYW